MQSIQSSQVLYASVHAGLYLHREGNIQHFTADRVQAVGERDDYNDEFL